MRGGPEFISRRQGRRPRPRRPPPPRRPRPRASTSTEILRACAPSFAPAATERARPRLTSATREERRARVRLAAGLAARAMVVARAGEPRWRARALGPRTRRSRSTTSSSSFACLFFQPFHGSLARGGVSGRALRWRRRFSPAGLGRCVGERGTRFGFWRRRRVRAGRACRGEKPEANPPATSVPPPHDPYPKPFPRRTARVGLRKLTTGQIQRVQHSIYV